MRFWVPLFSLLVLPLACFAMPEFVLEDSGLIQISDAGQVLTRLSLSVPNSDWSGGYNLGRVEQLTRHTEGEAEVVTGEMTWEGGRLPFSVSLQTSTGLGMITWELAPSEAISTVGAHLFVDLPQCPFPGSAI